MRNWHDNAECNLEALSKQIADRLLLGISPDVVARG